VAEGDDKEKLGKLYLMPTAETPVANIHREEILMEKNCRSVTAPTRRAFAARPARRASARAA
jgi:seryl-tRNA synthetase